MCIYKKFINGPKIVNNVINIDEKNKRFFWSLNAFGIAFFDIKKIESGDKNAYFQRNIQPKVQFLAKLNTCIFFFILIPRDPFREGYKWS